MSTVTNPAFDAMLNENVTNKLLELELKKRNFIYNQIPQDKNWKLNNNYVLPSIAGVASSVRFGSLTPAASIGSSRPIRGYESVHQEMWGSLSFNYKDLMIHDKVSEQNFLRILPDELERHMDYMNQVLGQNIAQGSAIDKCTSNGTSGGLISVSNPERFQIDQYVQFTSSVVTSAISGYVKTIDINSGQMHIVSAAGGSTDVDLSTLLVADGTYAYNYDQQANGFNSVAAALIPASAGGSPTLHNVSKLASPMYQGVYVDSSASTSATILKDIFKHYVKTRKVGQGKPTQILMSYNNFAACVNNIENQKGAFNVSPGSNKGEQYSWDEITVGGFLSNGQPVTLVALQEMNDSQIIHFDKSSYLFASNGGLRKFVTPDGIQYYTTRNTNGYTFIVDTVLMGNLFCKVAANNGLMDKLAITY